MPIVHLLLTKALDIVQGQLTAWQELGNIIFIIYIVLYSFYKSRKAFNSQVRYPLWHCFSDTFHIISEVLRTLYFVHNLYHKQFVLISDKYGEEGFCCTGFILNEYMRGSTNQQSNAARCCCVFQPFLPFEALVATTYNDFSRK